MSRRFTEGNDNAPVLGVVGGPQDERRQPGVRRVGGELLLDHQRVGCLDLGLDHACVSKREGVENVGLRHGVLPRRTTGSTSQDPFVAASEAS